MRASRGRAGKLSGDKGGNMETGALSVELRRAALWWLRFRANSAADPLAGCWKYMDELLVNVVVKPAMAAAELVLPYMGLNVETAEVDPPVADDPAAPL